MHGNRRARRDLLIVLICTLVVVGVVALGVAAVNRFPYLYENFVAWRWRIFLAMAVLPFTILGIAIVAFALLARLTKPHDRGPIS
jgi:uncharacterized membrane protein